MHKIKAQARRNAWYTTDGTERTHNFFGRTRPHVQLGQDEENRIQASRSEPAPLVVKDGDIVHVRPLSRARTEPTHSDEKTSNFTETDLEESAGRFSDPPETPDPEFVTHESANPDNVHVANSDGIRARKRKARIGLPRRSNTSDTQDSPQPKRKRPKYTFMSQFKAVFGFWLNLLLVFVPAGFALNYTHQNAAAIFVVNFIAIIPTAALVSFAVDELSMYVGEVIGGLLNMTFSNCVQLISSIFLLKSGQIAVLRSSLLGGILQNLLVMTGLAFLCGGFNRLEQYYNITLAQTISMLLLLAVLSLTIPTVSQLWNHTTHAGIVAQSRGTAVIIMVSYILWLFFQFKTHADAFNEPSQKVPKRSTGKKEMGETLRGIALIGAASGAATAGGGINHENLVREEEEEETPVLSRVGGLFTLLVATTLLAFNTQFATDSVQGIMQQHDISSTFMGIVILPILSNDLMTIDTAIKDKMDLSISLTLGRCMQTALMVIPLIVLIAWGMGNDEMTLEFDGFSVAAMFASIIIVTYVVQEGKSNWLTGALLLKVFIIIGLASFYIE